MCVLFCSSFNFNAERLSDDRCLLMVRLVLASIGMNLSLHYYVTFTIWFSSLYTVVFFANTPCDVLLQAMSYSNWSNVTNLS